jgi:hypothetical protein
MAGMQAADEIEQIGLETIAAAKQIRDDQGPCWRHALGEYKGHTKVGPDGQVRDLGSRHGTYINDRLIGLRAPEELPESAAAIATCGYELHDKDILGIGPVQFRVTVKGAEKTKAESAAGASRECPSPLTGSGPETAM